MGSIDSEGEGGAEGLMIVTLRGLTGHWEIAESTVIPSYAIGHDACNFSW